MRRSEPLTLEVSLISRRTHDRTPPVHPPSLAVVLALVLGLSACASDDDADTAQEDPAAPATPSSEVVVEEGPSEIAGDEDAVQDDATPSMSEVSQPDWAAPPPEETGGPMLLEPLVVEGEEAVVAVTGGHAYQTGAELRVAVRWDGDTAGAQQPTDPMGLQGGTSGALDDDSGDRLRVSVTYPDGGTATIGDGLTDGAAVDPDAPMLSQRSSVSAPSSADYDLWLWPLPDNGDALEVTVEWPAEGIDATGELPVEEMTAGAERSVPLTVR